MNDLAPRSRILVMHPDPLVSSGLVAVLCQHASFEILTGDTVSADHQIDVVIAEYAEAMRLADPAVRYGHRPLANARILALTTHDGEADVRRAVAAGVHGYLLLGGSLSELLEAVSAVAGGTRYLCRPVAQRIAESLTRESLTSRETEVLGLVAVGEPNKAIARRLRIELATVKSHMTAIMGKLGVNSRTQAARIATTRGLLEGPPHAALDAALL